MFLTSRSLPARILSCPVLSKSGVGTRVSGSYALSGLFNAEAFLCPATLHLMTRDGPRAQFDLMLLNAELNAEYLCGTVPQLIY